MFESIKKKFTFNECKDTFKKTIIQGNIQIFVSGNIQKNDVVRMSDKLYSYLNIKINTEKIHGNLNNIISPYIQKYKNKNKDEKNNIFSLIYKFTILENGKNNWNIYIAFASILESITNSLYFNILRTKEQIGYIVSTSLTKIGDNNYKLYGIKLMIQSYIKNSEYMYNRTIKFVNNELKNEIDNLKLEDFNDYKYGELSILKDNFSNIYDMNYYLSVNIFDGSYMYDYREIMINTFNNFTFETFKEMFYKYMIQKPEIYSVSLDSQLK